LSVRSEVLASVKAARNASRLLRVASGDKRNSFLQHLGAALAQKRALLLTANQDDLAAGKQKGLSTAMLDRLALNDKRINDLVQNTVDVAALPDPVGAVSNVKVLPSGLRVERRRVPLGVLMLIYEARPNATIEASALAIKSGNAIILRGGSEATHTNQALHGVLVEALRAAGLPAEAVAVLSNVSREDTIGLLALSDQIDLCIPRGGPALIQTVKENARMPVLAHGPGICHVFVDAQADFEQASRVTLDAKADRPATCNSAETLLVHETSAALFLPMFGKRYMETGGELRACPRSSGILAAAGIAHKPATESDFATEHLANILNVRVVPSFEDALAHIEQHGTRHTEAILTTSMKNAERFCRDVDASCVLVNASTRLNDGSCLGFGAELGISTSKFHAFGPMGLEALTIEKNVAVGDGQTRR
jgi:glutamate-5-semialdehyde dehydrogenase